MNDVLTLIIAIYTIGIPLLILFMFAEELYDDKNYKDFYFDNKILNELNTFGRFCYYVLTSFALVYYYIWINLTNLVKILFLKKDVKDEISK